MAEILIIGKNIDETREDMKEVLCYNYHSN